jgi:predicted RNA-binding Zn-ribbon protein involved in translation (DUF1610 family)
MADLRCGSCGKRVETENMWVAFPCPACSGETIVRCERCRRLSNAYKCSKCGFEGP